MKLKPLLRKAYDWVGKTFTLTDVEPWGRFSGTGTYSGKSISEISAMQVSTVWGCVRGLAESVGMLPWAVYERDAQGNSKKVDHPLAEILTESPNADMDDVAFKEATIANVALQGNGYCLRETRGDGSLLSLYPLVANNVHKRRNPQTNEIEFRVNDRGKWETLPAEKVWHVPGFGMNGLVGLSPISYMREAMGLSLAAEEFGARFFGEGATVSGIVKFPGWLKPDQREIARENLSQKYSGLGNAHKLMLLEGGMEFSEATTMPLRDAEFILLRGFQVDELCRIFRYPPHMVAKLDRATFSNIEEMSIEFVVYTLAPYLIRLERAANRWLLKPDERRRFFVRFNVDGLLRGDAETRSKFYAAMLQNGVYSRNEVRALENRNRVEGQGMDDYTVQSNMISADDLGAVAQSLRRRPEPARQEPAQ